MTDKTSNPTLPPGSELRLWCETWKGCLQSVLAQVSGNPAADCQMSSTAPAAAESDLWYIVTASGATDGEMAMRIPGPSGILLARMLLGEASASADAAAEAPISAEQKEALEELLRQVAGLAATAVGAMAGGAVQLQLAASAKPAWKPDATASLQSGDDIGLEIYISPPLAAALQARAQPAPVAENSKGDTPPAAAVESEATPPMNYRRLMDVGLDVKLRFGTRRMPLRDVLALSAGAVVELENSLNSPVDLLLDGRLIAQGEVVIVDGKYGLRVTEVVNSVAAGG